MKNIYINEEKIFDIIIFFENGMMKYESIKAYSKENAKKRFHENCTHNSIYKIEIKGRN